MKHLHAQSKTPKKTFFWSDVMMRDAVKDLISDVNINADFDVPYVAGYSKDGKTIYIDRHVPKKYHKYLTVHEAIEKILEETLGMDYFYAHQMALREERNAVEADGIKWEDYDREMQKLIKVGAHEKLEKVPADLDLAPYEDEKDFALVRHMKAKMAGNDTDHVKLIAIKDAAIDAAIAHLSEDSKQKGMPAGEKKEDLAMVEKLKSAKNKKIIFSAKQV